MKFDKLTPLHDSSNPHACTFAIEYALRFLVDDCEWFTGTGHTKQSLEWTLEKVVEYGVFDERVDWTKEEILGMMIACQSGINRMKTITMCFRSHQQQSDGCNHGCKIFGTLHNAFTLSSDGLDFIPVPQTKFDGVWQQYYPAKDTYHTNWNEWLMKRELLNPSGIQSVFINLQLAMLVFRATLLTGETDWDAWVEPKWVSDLRSEPETIPIPF